jgi:hypothetical protein
MDATRALLAGPKAALGSLAGQVTTLENSVADYRQTLLGSDILRSTEAAYNALLLVQGKAPEKTLDITDLKRAGSLKASQQLVADRCTDWTAAGEELLTGTGVPFGLCSGIVKGTSDGAIPELATDQIGKLVEKGFLEVTYRLGKTR